MSREQPQQQPPPVQRLRIRYAKRGRLRFTSHRDFSRAFERAVFRARVPMAYSSGFNPHPRISYAGAAPTGSASEAEYLEIALAQAVDIPTVQALLSEALPTGLDILEVVDSTGPALTELLQASRWLVEVAVPAAVLMPAVEAFRAAGTVTVERMTKKGLREFDCRAPVVELSAVPASGPTGEDGAATRLELLLRHTVPSVRPDDVLTGIALHSGLQIDAVPLLTRLSQGLLDEETHEISDPLHAS
jgi:radical SAM-linked protein